MKKIVFNGGVNDWTQITGVNRYLLSILEEVDKRIQPGEVELVILQENTNLFTFQNIRTVGRKVPGKGAVRKVIWGQFIFPNYVRKSGGLGVDLIQTLPVWGCDVVILHDCIRELFPSNSITLTQKLSLFYYRIRTKCSVHQAKKVLTVSKNARKDISRLYNCSEESIDVIYDAWQHFLQVEEEPEILERLQLTEQSFFFAVGSRFPHKNHRWIEEAARQNPHYFFVISGEERGYSAAKEKPVNVQFTGYLRDGEIKSLMAHCKAFLQPSFYEGFGIPPMEAMSVGARCIVANATALPEIYGDSVWYIDPHQYEAIDMDQIMRKTITSNDVILEKYSWEKSAEKLLTVLKPLR